MAKKFSLKSLRRSLRESEREMRQKAKALKNDVVQGTERKKVDGDLT
jgi:hypothetical protein